MKGVFDPKAKLLWHGDRIKQWLETGKSKPVLVEISPTGFCNARCPWCFFKDKVEPVMLSKNLVNAMMTGLCSVGIRAINWTGGGEPTLHPNLSDMVIAADLYGFEQGIFTNAYKPIPHEDLFKWIRISLTSEWFKPIVKPKVPFGICLNQIESQTEHELRQICMDALKFGASYFQIRPALAGSHQKQVPMEPPLYLKDIETDEFRVYITEYKYEEAVLPREYSRCYGYHFCPSIDWYGNVCACLYMNKEPKCLFGNINNEPIESIWQRIPNSVSVLDECQTCCKNHEINRLLDSAKKVEQVNFI